MKIVTIVLLAVIIGICGCSTPSDPYINKEVPDYYKRGTITYKDISMGFYGIVANDSTKYLPLNLEEKFMKDGMRIAFLFKIRRVNTTVMWGTPITIIDMIKL